MTAFEMAWQIAGALESAAGKLPTGPERNLLEAIVDAISLAGGGDQQSTVPSAPPAGQALHR
jgi:hypothetical protein